MRNSLLGVLHLLSCKHAPAATAAAFLQAGSWCTALSCKPSRLGEWLQHITSLLNGPPADRSAGHLLHKPGHKAHKERPRAANCHHSAACRFTGGAAGGAAGDLRPGSRWRRSKSWLNSYICKRACMEMCTAAAVAALRHVLPTTAVVKLAEYQTVQVCTCGQSCMPKPRTLHPFLPETITSWCTCCFAPCSFLSHTFVTIYLIGALAACAT
jgi:hypothetical protein